MRYETVVGSVLDIKSKANEMSEVSYKIRPMRREDVSGFTKLAKENSLQNPITTLHSWMTYDPEGILVAVSETGTVLGMCSAVKNSDDFYFGGLFCVGKEYRHLDIAIRLFNLVERRTLAMNLGINARQTVINFYKRRCFKLIESDWSSLEYETTDGVDPTVLTDGLPPGMDIVPYDDGIFSSIATYDRSVVHMDRTDILDFSLHEDDSLTLVAVQDGACVGYGCIKMAITGAGRVGPLYADDPRVAETMLRRLIMEFPEAKGVAIATYSSNLHANKWMKTLGVGVYDNFVRMYSKGKLCCDVSKIFGQFDTDFTPF